MVFTQRPGRGNNNNNNGPIDNEPYISPSRAMTGPIHTPNSHQGQPGYGPQMPYGPGYPQNPHFNQQGYPPQQGPYGPQPGPYPQPQSPYFDPRGHQQQYPPQQGPYGPQQQVPPQPQSQRPQRQEDLKGLSFWQEEEENSYRDDGDDGIEKSSPFKFVIVVTGLIIVSGVLWLGYRWATKSESDLVLIQAEEGPYKVRPDQPGGVSYPHQDMLVYGRLSPNAPNAQVERITPQDPYADQRQYQQQQQHVQHAQQQPVVDNQMQQPVLAPQIQQIPVQQPQQFEQKQPVVEQNVQSQQSVQAPVQQAVPEQPVQPAVTQQAPQAQPSTPVEQPKVTQPVIEPAKKEVQQEQPKVKKEAKTKVMAEVKTTLDAGYYMQLASLPKEESAKKEWARIRDDKKYAAELADLNAYIKQSDMGIKKVYSLFVGPFTNRDTALKKCIALVKGCKVIEVKTQ